MNVCPVYRNIGGHAYGSVYNGPIGAVIIPHIKGMDKFAHLSFASTLCGKCNEVCPVKIDITRLLLLNRKDATEQKLTGKYDSMGISIYKKVMHKRSLLEMIPVAFKKTGIKVFFKYSWGKRRAFPEFSNKSFNRQWKNTQV
jgi:L-lactate dehydrogenase complex protein LldF